MKERPPRGPPAGHPGPSKEALHALADFRHLFIYVTLVVEPDSAGHECFETSGMNIYD
jgi:hypothetical protein